MIETNPTIYWLWLEMIFGVANVKLHDLIEREGGVQPLYYALHDPDSALLKEKERQKLRKTPLEQAKKIMEYCNQHQIGIITWDDALYPERLQQIYNPPVVLFYRGNPALLQEGMLLTCVGTRHPSEYSRKVADWICTDLARCNITICSGCAAGLDAVSHWAAVRQNTPTIAVLGCGVDFDYPKENRELKNRIVQNGLLLSEYFPGTQPFPANFPVRNRILAGIGEAVLVLEANSRSGSLITANLAVEQGKSVFCIPPADLFDKRYSGVVSFLRDGAYPVFNHLDVLYAFYLKYPHKLSLYDEEDASRTEDSLLFAEEKPRRVRRVRKESERSAPEPQESPKPYAFPEEANEQQRRILALLKDGAQNINAVCVMLGTSFEMTSMLMMEMEMLGWIVNTERDLFALPEGSET